MSAGSDLRIGRAGALALLILMGAMWGLQFAMLKLAARGGYSDLAVLLMALALLSLAFATLSKLRGGRIWPARDHWPFYLVMSLLGYVLPLLAVLFASTGLGAGMLTLIGSMSPVVAIAIALVLRSEPVSRSRLLALVLGLASAVAILGPRLEPGQGLAWTLAAFAVPLCYGIESIYVARRWPDGLGPLDVVTSQTIVATLIVLPLIVLIEGLPALPEQPGQAELAVLVFVSAGVVESLLYFVLIRARGGVFVNFGTFVALFAGIGWGALLFGEVLSVLAWGAVGLLVASLWLAIRE